MNARHRPGTILSGALLLLGLLLAAGNEPRAALAQSAEPKKKAAPGIAPPPDDVNYLSMEVNALRTLYLLRGSEDDESVATQNPIQRLHVIKNSFASCTKRRTTNASRPTSATPTARCSSTSGPP